MPDFINKEYRDAEIELNKLPIELEIIVVDEYHDSVTENYIVETKPPADEELVEGQLVYLIYSKGPQIKENRVPNVVDKSEDAARISLEDMKFIAVPEYRYDAETLEGRVISQSPVANVMAPYKSEVKIVVSLGPEPAPESPSPSEPISPDVPPSPDVPESPDVI